eukprot:comp42045_c0_seq1/m.47452 comp42045_c0_seq1/g.47452  ORF comp42045_c0_seq1/g.47452 comp42045_c0_seq1/m.47452 type:complete len:354 (-) comp42045_c0_seq1:73-1134(-)
MLAAALLRRLPSSHVSAARPLARALAEPFLRRYSVAAARLTHDTSDGQQQKKWYVNSNQPYPRTFPADYTAGHVGARSLRGMRPYNEDRYRIAQLSPSIWYIGLYDGHGGSRCADFVAARMHYYLHQHLQGVDEHDADLCEVLRKGFHSTSWELDVFIAASLDTPQEIRCGTTALVALVRGSHDLALAHVGDCRALFVGAEGSEWLNNPHTLLNGNERARVLRCGGEVYEDSEGLPRVNGKLTVARAFGDSSLRQYGVIPEPEVMDREIHAQDGFMIMATDGLWDVMDAKQATGLVQQSTSPTDAAARLCMEAELAGTQDNTTVLVVRMPAWDALTGRKSAPVDQLTRLRRLS